MDNESLTVWLRNRFVLQRSFNQLPGRPMSGRQLNYPKWPKYPHEAVCCRAISLKTVLNFDQPQSQDHTWLMFSLKKNEQAIYKECVFGVGSTQNSDAKKMVAEIVMATRWLWQNPKWRRAAHPACQIRVLVKITYSKWVEEGEKYKKRQSLGALSHSNQKISCLHHKCTFWC